MALNYYNILNTSAATLAMTTAAAQTAALPDGLYVVTSDVVCYIQTDALASEVTTANGFWIPANTYVVIKLSGNSKIGAIVPTSTGTLRYQKVATE